MNDPTKRTWAEVHLDRLERNYKALRALLPQGCRFMGLVKANAYGHGAAAVARRLEALGTDYLAVACLDEAEELRQAGIKAPILILGGTEEADVPRLLELGLTQTVYDLEQAKAYAGQALALGRTLKVHLKADTGMSRLGVLCGEDPEQAAGALAEMARLPGLEAEGLFTHFSDADGSDTYSRMQMERFSQVREALARRGVTAPLVHSAASAAVLRYPQSRLDMVRPGILLYGHHPDASTRGLLELEPVMEVKSRVTSVKELPAGTCVSYGRTLTLERDSRVAVLPIGYADGLFRLLSNRMEVLLHGRRAPQIGRVCMDMCMVDVTDLPGVKPGDVATVFGDGLPVEEKADALGTISYELLCAVSPRVPRVHRGEP